MLTKILFGTCMLFSTISGVVSLKTNMRNPNAVNEEYEIYPLPHSIEYKNDVITIKDNVYLNASDHIDKWTIEKAFDVFSLKDVRVHKSNNQLSNGYTTLELLTQDDTNLSNEFKYFENKYDAFYLNIEENKITVFGKDTDAVFHGLSSLEYIFSQTGNKRDIRQLIIKDYSDLKYRGFIEGFYGVPWSAEQREELMRFGGKNKGNMYIYAPKDDKYHSATWRELYDPENYERIKEQVEAGNRSKNYFTWAIHPFINNPLTEAHFDEDMRAAIAKLDQLYQAGVRQFLISGDDAVPEGVLNPDGSIAPDYKEKNLAYAKVQNRALNLFAKWQKEKGDCRDLLFVPGAYCYDAEYALGGFNCEYYFRGLVWGDDGVKENIKDCSTYLDESIQIMWTGEHICDRLSTGKIDEFIEYTYGRKPFIWMNFPVNDYSPSVIRLGPGEVYDLPFEDTDSAKVGSIVANLMLEPESSKAGIFAACDYCWNTRDFDNEKSYRDSLKYIEPNTPDSLFEISEHLRNTNGHFGAAFFKEGRELAKLVELFKEEKEAGDVSNSVRQLFAYFEKLENACTDFLTHGANKTLIKEIEAWVKSIRYGSLSAENYLKVIINKDNHDEALFYKKQASNLLNLHYHQAFKSPNAMTYSVKYVDVDPGLVVLRPFLTLLDDVTSDFASLTGIKTNLELDDYFLDPNSGLTYTGILGKMDYIFDGDLSTSAYFTFKDWVYSLKFELTFDYGSPQTISSIDLIQGETDRLWCWIEYSNDGINYQRIPYVSEANKNLPFAVDNNGLIDGVHGDTNGDGVVNDSDYWRAIPNTHIEFSSPITARYIRLKNFHTNCRILIYELMLNGEAPTPKDIITFHGIELANNQDINSLLDGGAVTFKPFTENEMMIDYDLGETKSIKQIKFFMDNEYKLNEYVLLISNDGYNYYEYDGSKVEEARFVRIYSSSPTNKKVIINYLEVKYE